MKLLMTILIAFSFVITGCGSEISYFKRGYRFEKQGKYEKAIKAYNKSLKHDPDYALSYFGLGSVYSKNNSWDEALTNLLKAENLGLDDDELHMLLGSVYEALDDLDKAAIEYGKAIKERPKEVTLHLKLGRSIENEKDFEGALSEYKAAIAIATDFPEAYFHSARMLLKLKRIKESEEMYLQSIKLKNGSYPQAQNNLTVLYIETNQIMKAYESAGKTRNIDEGYIPGIVNMGILHELLEDDKTAEKYYREAIKKDPGYGMGHYRLALLMMKNEELKKAEEELKFAIMAAPDFPPAHNELGLLELKKGNYKKALDHLKNAVRIDSTYAVAYYNMGGILANNGKYLKAAAAYNKYLTFGESPEDANEVISRIRILMAVGKDK